MLKELKTKEEQREILGFGVKSEYEVYIEENTRVAIFINKDNGNVSFEIASEELPFEVIEDIYNLAKRYKK